MKFLLSLIIVAGIHAHIAVAPPVIFTVESPGQSFNFAVKGGKIVAYEGCLFPGPFGPLSADPYSWHDIRTYFEKAGYKVRPYNVK